jgi:hypothetical protein
MTDDTKAKLARIDAMANPRDFTLTGGHRRRWWVRLWRWMVHS